jgi:outer membrane protein assembly factor BamB
MVEPKKGLRRLLPALAGLALAAHALAAPAVGEEPPLPQLPSRTLAIGASTAAPQVPWLGFDSNPPKLHDLDGDGSLELLAQNDNHWVYVFDTRSGALLAEVTTTIPDGWLPRSFNGPEAGVLVPGEAPRVVVANSAAVVTSFRYDAESSTRHQFALAKEWERKLDDCRTGSGMDARPVFADLDRDGDLEILAATEDRGVFALRADGSLLWVACIVGGNANPTVADLDLDGWDEVVFGSDLGLVSVLDGRTGATKWEFDVKGRFGLGSGSIPTAITVGQVDGKGGPDLLLGARDSHDPVDWTQDHALLAAIDSGGSLLWARQDPEGNPLTYTHPLLVDADGDGEAEIYWQDWNTVGHYPPFEPAKMWALTGPANVYRYDLEGDLVWRQSLDAWWSNKDLVVLDADGDGDQEVLANGPSPAGSHDGLWLLDPRTGAKEGFLDLFPWKVGRAPVVADLHGTGTYQFVVEAAQHAPASNGPAFLVYDTRSSTIPAWPHAPYVTLDGNEGRTPTGTPSPRTDRPPATQAPAPTPTTERPGSGFTLDGLRALGREPPAAAPEPEPRPTAPLEATFGLGPLPPFGLQASVEADREVAHVEVRVDGGGWQPMARTPWGTWAALAPRGASVELRATDLAGTAAESGPLPWPSGSREPFTASFAPVAVPGPAAQWWVEVRVDASAPVAAVTAHVGDGPAVPLQPTAWGTWARSLHVPPGAALDYEAADADGRTSHWGITLK